MKIGFFPNLQKLKRRACFRLNVVFEHASVKLIIISNRLYKENYFQEPHFTLSLNFYFKKACFHQYLKIEVINTQEYPKYFLWTIQWNGQSSQGPTKFSRFITSDMKYGSDYSSKESNRVSLHKLYYFTSCIIFDSA